MPMFKKLILIGRPASGKSEFIDFIKKTPEETRKSKYHIGDITELDDFLWLWQKFLEDDVWENAGHKRLFSRREEHGYIITDGSLLDFCLEKFNAEVPKAPQEGTLFVEFARGKGDGGYSHALNRLNDTVLRDAAILFLFTSYEEACRRNEARYVEKLKHSVLAHKVPEADMIRFAKEIDWLELTDKKSQGFLQIRSNKIPFVTITNEPELKDWEGLERRYKQALDNLMELNLRRPT